MNILDDQSKYLFKEDEAFNMTKHTIFQGYDNINLFDVDEPTWSNLLAKLLVCGTSWWEIIILKMKMKSLWEKFWPPFFIFHKILCNVSWEWKLETLGKKICILSSSFLTISFNLCSGLQEKDHFSSSSSSY